MTCSVCRHQQRAEIDIALVRPDSLRAIAGRFGTSKSALERHRANCISEQLSKSKELSDVGAASALVRELRELTRKTGEVLARALNEKNGDLALKAIGRLERQLELKGRLLGKLEERGGDVTHVQVTYVDRALFTSGASSPGGKVSPASMSRTNRPLISQVEEASDRLTDHQMVNIKPAQEEEA